MNGVWQFLILVRVLTTLLPQRGYIHPDEFFQNPEITAESVLGFDSYQSWEWTSKEIPLRNVIFPYATSGTAFLILHLLQKLIPGIIDSYSLLVFPRILMASLSLLLDLLVYKMCVCISVDSEACIALLASSYVILVFCCRTFANGLECILFAMVMLLVLKSSPLIHKCKTEGKKCFQLDSMNAGLLSVILTIGFFLRLSFAAFIVWPMFFWYLSIVYHHGYMTGIKYAMSLIPGVFITSLFFITVDSIYYGSLQFSQFTLTNLVKTFSSVDIVANLTITPFNFYLYNTDITKLSEQTLHPHITHLVLNVPLLFCPLLIWGTPQIVTSLTDLFKTYKIRSIDKTNVFLLLSFVIPVAILSFIPHQEARFLIPVIIPLLLLFCKNVKEYSYHFKMSWVVWNIIGFMFFGMVHQGGLLPCMHTLHNLAKHNPQTNYHFIFFHTYMPPKHLLALEKSSESHMIGSPANKNVTFNHVTVHDLAGADFKILTQTIEKLSKYSSHFEKDFEVEEEKVAIYVISPSALHQYFCIHDNYEFTLEDQFYFHLGLEDGIGAIKSKACLIVDKDNDFMTFIKNDMSLNLYKLTT